MTDFVFITGNLLKVEYLEKWLGRQVEHQKIDLDELQSLDPREVAEHKVRQAYAIVQRPILVDDVTLTFTGMGRLPGTYIRWFLEELEPLGLCRLADRLPTRDAVAGVTYAFFNGKDLAFFSATVKGAVASEPRQSEATGWKVGRTWNSIFVPEGHTKTYAEMTDEELRPISHRALAIEKLRIFLQ